MLAAIPKTWADFTNRLPGFWELLGITFIVFVLIWGIFRLKAWFRDDDDPADAERQLLLQLHEMTREGELSEDEYRLLKRKLGVSVAESIGGPFQKRPAIPADDSRGQATDDSVDQPPAAEQQNT